MAWVFSFGTPAAVLADDLDAARMQNWHQWRGPLATGVAPYGDPPLKWDEKSNIKWKAEIPGLGSSTPIVWGDQVFVLSAIKTDRKPETPPQADARAKTAPEGNYYAFVVLSFDRATGKLRWKEVACEAVPHEGRHNTNTYASASPTTDGRRLYVSFGSRGIYCYDLAGKLQWKRELGRMRTRYGWGEAISPVVHGDSLIINWDHEDDSFIVSLDAGTGETKWRADRDEPTSWATPLVVSQGGREQVVVNATNRVRAYDLATGQVLWQCGGQTTNVIASPVASGGVVYCMSSYGDNAAYAIPLDSSGDITGSGRVLWSHHRGTPYVPSPLLLDDRLYFLRSNGNILTCLDAKTGRPLIDQVRVPALKNIYASPTAAAGRIYLVDRDGTTIVLNAATAGRDAAAEVMATNKLDDPIDASPAIVGRELFLRGRGHLYCISEN